MDNENIEPTRLLGGQDETAHLPSEQDETAENQEKIYWHEAFFAALQLEFHDYADVLTFENEHQLSKKALSMDVLVIKKAANVQITKNIGQIFRMHNIFEYKSETDNLTKWDYNKVVGCANLYSAFEEIPVDEITITFVVTPKPVKLLKYLVNERGFTVDKISPGIYQVKGDTFATQILESKHLGENVFLKNLRSNLTAYNISKMLKLFRKVESLEKENMYINRIYSANVAEFEEALDMVNLDARYAFVENFKKNGFLDAEMAKTAENTKRETAFEMLKRNFATKDIADILAMPTEWVQNLKDNPI